MIRLWQLDVETLLRGPIGLLPMAPLADVDEVALPRVIETMNQRMTAEAPDRLDDLWVSSYILMGLKFPVSVIDKLTHGVMKMKDSATYQKIYGDGKTDGRLEGRGDEARRLIERLGSRKLGPISAAVKSALDAINSVEHLEDLVERVTEISAWSDLLDTSANSQ